VFSGAELPFPTPRAPDGCVDGFVMYPDARVEDCPLPDRIVCNDNPPSAARVMRKISWYDLQLFPGNVEIAEMDVERCVSVLVLRVASSLPRDTRGSVR
jgi:hypothetical protein